MTTMVKLKSKPGGIGAKGSACAQFFHPGQNIRDKWPNTHRTHRVLDALIVVKGIHRVEDAAATPFDDKRPLQTVVSVSNAQEIDQLVNNELCVSESDAVSNVCAGGEDCWPRRLQNFISRG
eukprot:2628954-Ditylum_brightwellii.AAC.1